MKDSIRSSLESLQEKANSLSNKLSDPSITSDISKLTNLNKEFAEIKDVVENWSEYQTTEKTLTDLENLLNDDEMKDMATEEKLNCEERLRQLESEIMIQLLPKDKDDSRNSFLELRAGAGGDEAAIFVGDLYRMFSRYAERSNWKTEQIKEVVSGPGGFKEVVIKIIGNDSYGKLKFESGVHRVQRVPLTESQGRIHTSTATVAVMPEMDDIQEKDLDIEFENIKVDGGMVENNLLMQFQSDILNKSVMSQNINEITSLGVGVASYIYIKKLPIEEMGKYFSTEKTWSPNMNNDSRIKTLSLWYKAIERSKHWL